MKFECRITAQRKNRPLYFTTEEQFQWMIAILQHFVPDIELSLEGLKAVGTRLGISTPADSVPPQQPRQILPANLQPVGPPEEMSDASPSPEPSEIGEDEESLADEGPMNLNQRILRDPSPLVRGIKHPVP